MAHSKPIAVLKNKPITGISWYGIAVFSNAISQSQSLASAYNTNSWTLIPNTQSYRLPNEIEWEYAARANLPTLYSGSDNIDLVAWTLANCGEPVLGQINNVAQKNTNAFSLYDMSGNASEWTEGPYASTFGQVFDNNLRAIKGGNFKGDDLGLRPGNRSSTTLSTMTNSLGFRIVKP